jgi:hypothetical protein
MDCWADARLLMRSDAGIAEAISDFFIAEIACVSCLLLPIYFVNLLFFNFFDACSDIWVLADILLLPNLCFSGVKNFFLLENT